MIDPRLWASTPFDNRTALVDFAGTFFLWHRALSDTIARTLNRTYRTFPIGTPGGRSWLRAIQKQHEGAAQALGIAPPPDLQSYDLKDPEDSASFFFILSEDAQRLRKAAGLT